MLGSCCSEENPYLQVRCLLLVSGLSAGLLFDSSLLPSRFSSILIGFSAGSLPSVLCICLLLFSWWFLLGSCSAGQLLSLLFWLSLFSAPLWCLALHPCLVSGCIWFSALSRSASFFPLVSAWGRSWYPSLLGFWSARLLFFWVPSIILGALSCFLRVPSFCCFCPGFSCEKTAKLYTLVLAHFGARSALFGRSGITGLFSFKSRTWRTCKFFVNYGSGDLDFLRNV